MCGRIVFFFFFFFSWSHMPTSARKAIESLPTSILSVQRKKTSDCTVLKTIEKETCPHGIVICETIDISSISLKCKQNIYSSSQILFWMSSCVSPLCYSVLLMHFLWWTNLVNMHKHIFFSFPPSMLQCLYIYQTVSHYWELAAFLWICARLVGIITV